MNNENGQTLVMFALMAVSLIGFTTLLFGFGISSVKQRQLQKIADKAAMVAAQELPDTSTAKLMAVQYAGKNGATNIVPISPYKGDPEKIEVVVSENVSEFLAVFLEIMNVDVSARAVAHKSPGNVGFAIFTSNSKRELKLNGENIIIEGDVHTNHILKVDGKNITINGHVEQVKQKENRDEQTFNGDMNIFDSANQIHFKDYINRIGFSIDLENFMNDIFPVLEYKASVTFREDPGTSIYTRKLNVFTDGDIIALNTQWIYGVEEINIFGGGTVKIFGNLFVNDIININTPGAILEIYGSLYSDGKRIEVNSYGGSVSLARIIGSEVIINTSNLTVNPSMLDSINPQVILIE
jgi:hypothetical protein